MHVILNLFSGIVPSHLFFSLTSIDLSWPQILLDPLPNYLTCNANSCSKNSFIHEYTKGEFIHHIFNHSIVILRESANLFIRILIHLFFLESNRFLWFSCIKRWIRMYYDRYATIRKYFDVLGRQTVATISRLTLFYQISFAINVQNRFYKKS